MFPPARRGTAEGTPIVLLHAVAVSSPLWFANVAALGEHHPVYAIDTITDAGRSIPTAPVRDECRCASVARRNVGGTRTACCSSRRIVVWGWLALNQARRAPDRVASVTSVDPPGAIGRMKMNVGFLPDAALALLKSEPALHRLLQKLNNGKLPPPDDRRSVGGGSSHVPPEAAVPETDERRGAGFHRDPNPLHARRSEPRHERRSLGGAGQATRRQRRGRDRSRRRPHASR